MKDFEVINEGIDREATIGSSWNELNEAMEFYFPNPEIRTQKYLFMLKGIIDAGWLQGKTVTLTPRAEVNLDLSDVRISSLIEGTQQKGEY